MINANEIPSWLIELSQQMNNQDNRCTNHPFWQVRCKRFVSAPSSHSDNFEIIYDSDVVFRKTENEADHLYELIDFEFKKQYCIHHHFWEGEDCAEWGKEDEFESSVVEFFAEHFDTEDDDLPDEFERVHVQEVEEVVWTGLTEEAARQFIKRKQHDYPALYTYVESAYWSPQFSQLIDWVKSITGGEL